MTLTGGVTYTVWTRAGNAWYGDVLVYDSGDNFHLPTTAITVTIPLAQINFVTVVA